MLAAVRTPTEGIAEAPAPTVRPPDSLSPQDAVVAVFGAVPSGRDRELLLQIQQRLQKAQQDVRPTAEPAGFAHLARVLPDSILNLRANAPALNGPTRIGDDLVGTVARVYGTPARHIYVKITDAAASRQLRQGVLRDIDSFAPGPNGYAHGRLVQGYPALVQYYLEARNSQLTALVGNRYVVEVRVVGAAFADEAQRAFSAVSWAALAPPERAAR